jgi:hypothetical protein
MPGTPGTPASTGARRSEGTTMTAAPCFISFIDFHVGAFKLLGEQFSPRGYEQSKSEECFPHKNNSIPIGIEG